MSSHRTEAVVLAVGFILACAGSARAQQDHATPQEVVQRVQQAAQAIAKAGEAGLATYGSKNDTSVWKDSYVFIVSCEGGSAGHRQVKLEEDGEASKLARAANLCDGLGASYLGPGREGLRADGSVLGGRKVIAVEMEEVVDLIMSREEPLRLAG